MEMVHPEAVDVPGGSQPSQLMPTVALKMAGLPQLQIVIDQ